MKSGKEYSDEAVLKIYSPEDSVEDIIASDGFDNTEIGDKGSKIDEIDEDDFGGTLLLGDSIRVGGDNGEALEDGPPEFRTSIFWRLSSNILPLLLPLTGLFSRNRSILTLTLIRSNFRFIK